MDAEGRAVQPDVIVHVPGPEGPNVAAIEIKGWWSADDGSRDAIKLAGYRSKQRYAFAYFVRLEQEKASVTSL
jgi:hypothetical protein